MFKESMSLFTNTMIDRFGNTKIQEDKICSISQHILSKYIAPLVLKLSTEHKDETKIYSEKLKEDLSDSEEMKELVQKCMKGSEDLHGKYEFTDTDEVDFIHHQIDSMAKVCTKNKEVVN